MGAIVLTLKLSKIWWSVSCNWCLLVILSKTSGPFTLHHGLREGSRFWKVAGTYHEAGPNWQESSLGKWSNSAVMDTTLRCSQVMSRVVVLVPFSVVYHKGMMCYTPQLVGATKTRRVCYIGSKPLQCNSTKRQNLPIWHNCYNYWTHCAILKSFFIKNVIKLWLIVYFITVCIISYLLGLPALWRQLGKANQSVRDLMTMGFVEQPLANNILKKT